VHDARRDVTVDPAPNSLGATGSDANDPGLKMTPAPVLDEIEHRPFAREIDADIALPKHEEETDDVTPIKSNAILEPKNVLDDVVQEREELHEGPNDEETKNGRGWLVEKRILVTTDSTNKTNVSPDSKSEPEPQNASRPTSVETNDTKLHGDEPFQPEVELEDSESELSANIDAAPAVPETKLPEVGGPVSTVTTTPVAQEMTPSLPPAKELDTPAIASKKATPTQFLDLPAGEWPFTSKSPQSQFANILQRYEKLSTSGWPNRRLLECAAPTTLRSQTSKINLRAIPSANTTPSHKSAIPSAPSFSQSTNRRPNTSSTYGPKKPT
jgi:hypothetical protein